MPITARLKEMQRQLVFWAAAALLAALALIFFAMAAYMKLAERLGEPLAAAAIGLALTLLALILYFLGRRRHKVPPLAVAAAAVPPAPARPMEALLVAFLLGVIDEQFGRRPRR